jgi:hypothetical protein
VFGRELRAGAGHEDETDVWIEGEDAAVVGVGGDAGALDAGLEDDLTEGVGDGRGSRSQVDDAVVDDGVGGEAAEVDGQTEGGDETAFAGEGSHGGRSGLRMAM